MQIHTISPEETSRAAEILVRAELENVEDIQCTGSMLHFNYRGQKEEIYQVLKILVNTDVRVVAVGQQQRNLEDIFMKVTHGDLS